MHSRAHVVGLCAGLLLLCAPARAVDTIILPPDNSVIKIPTPLANGPVYVLQNGWVMLGPVRPGWQRILRVVHDAGHEVLRGRADWLTIEKGGTASVRFSTVPAAEGETWTVRIACEVEEMERGAKSGFLYQQARIELTIVADMRKYLGDFFLAPGDEVSVPIPRTMRVRRVSSIREKVAVASHDGSRLVITAKEAGETKVTLNYWIGDESERFSREVEVTVSDPRLEFVCPVEPSGNTSVDFADIGKALSKALPGDDGKVVRIVRWDGPQSANLSIEPTAVRVGAGAPGRSSAVVVFEGEKRNRGFQAWLHFTVVAGDAPVAGAPPPSTPPPAPAGPAPGAGRPQDGSVPAGTPPPATEPAAPTTDYKLLNKFGAAVGDDYAATANLQNVGTTPLELEVTIHFKDRAGQDLGEELATGPKSIAPGKRGSFKATLKGGGRVIETIEVTIRIVSPKAE